jgi:hypothetical protein
MKTITLKFKAAVLAVSLLAGIPAHAMTHEQFMASMVKEVGQTMFTLLDLVDNFVTKTCTDKLPAFIKALADRIKYAEAVNQALKAELDAVAASTPGTPYHKLLQATYEYAQEMALTQLKNFHAALDGCKKTGKTHMDLIGVLNAQKTTLAGLDKKLDQKLKDIQALLIAEGQSTNAQAIVGMISKIETKLADIKKKAGLNLITICKFRWN